MRISHLVWPGGWPCDVTHSGLRDVSHGCDDTGHKCEWLLVDTPGLCCWPVTHRAADWFELVKLDSWDGKAACCCFLAILRRFIWSDYNQYFSNTIIWNDNKDKLESASPLSFAELYSQFQLNCSVFAPSHSSHSVVLREQTTCWALKSRQTQLETS